MREKEKLIELENPKLKIVRLGFRQILLREFKKRLIALLDKESELLGSKTEEQRGSILPEERLIVNQKNKLRNELSASIVVCAACTDIEGDHIFTSRNKVWYCVECYEILEESYAKEIEALKRLN